MLPKLNDCCPLLAQVEKLSGVPVQMDFLQGSWETFGPQLEVRNRGHAAQKRCAYRTRDAGAGRVAIAAALAPAVPRSDLLSIPSRSERHAGRRPAGRGPWSRANRRSDAAPARPFRSARRPRSHSWTPAGARRIRHSPTDLAYRPREAIAPRGRSGLSTLNGQHGVVRLRMDLRNRGLLDTGTAYLQADTST
ncbi:hypothetical protein M8494_28775 [Serratia ureilytica]